MSRKTRAMAATVLVGGLGAVSAPAYAGAPYASAGLNVFLTPGHRIPVGLGLEVGAGRVGDAARGRGGAFLRGDLMGIVHPRVVAGARWLGFRGKGTDVAAHVDAGLALRRHGKAGVVVGGGVGVWDIPTTADIRLEGTIPFDRAYVDELRLHWDLPVQEISLVGGARIETRSQGLDDGTVAGRPLRHRGRPVLPAALTGPLDPAAAHWLMRARTEHASVPAFEQLAAELAALGAPRRLIGRALQAAREELGHARLCYGEVARRTRRPVLVGPAPRAVDRGGDRQARLDRMLREALLDGIRGEGEAARQAARDRDAAREDRVARIEHTIVVEESGHARLAEDVYRWARDEGARGIA